MLKITFWRAYLLSSLAILLLAASFFAGYLAHDRLARPVDFPVLQQAYRILSEQGLNDLPAAPAIEYGMIRGMTQAYADPYTIFVEPVQHQLESDALQGSFGGIGVNLVRDEQGHWLLYPFPNQPAMQAGVQDGDRLLRVEDLVVDNQTSAEMIQARVRGKVGSPVTITIGRAPGYASLEITITRAEIALPSVTFRLDTEHPQVGILAINRVAASTPEEIRQAMTDLADRGAAYYVLDLRYNGGGLLDAGIEVARLFLAEGTVMEQQYRGKSVESFHVEKPGAYAQMPLVVLINGGTASAAEIIAGALQAQGRALLVGSRSFGKATIQLIFDLQDGSSLHVTAARWWVPGLAAPIADNGLQPDITVEAPADPNAPDGQLLTAIDSLLAGVP